MAVELLDCMGNDLTITNMARQSFGRRKGELSDADIGLLNSLASPPSGVPHGAPWEHVVFQFKVWTSIRVAREWMRHRIGSFSEISTRYAEMKAGVMETPRPRAQHGKPMQYTFEEITGPLGETMVEIFEDSLAMSLGAYHRLLEMGASKEWAAYVLPLATITEFSWTVNFRSLSNFMALRTHETALAEFRKEAMAVETLVMTKVPHAMDAWNNAGRPSL